ncbi:concanavalin A-like lectin/glucanase domain-containing protein [Rhizophagus irregularis DAOM 181602=DAOM 197198]|nr:concanavalin A-like lectin/glucanase domain-containing protein [Rhizophagus irregularis DAOM 181602=DAOM 197198]
MVFVAMRKRSKSLYILFYIASLIEIVIILFRLVWSFRLNYYFYYYPQLDYDILHSIEFFIEIIENDIQYRERFFIVYRSEILLQRIGELEFLKKPYKKILKFLGKESLKTDEWKFVPESRILLLNIVQIMPYDDNDDKKDEDIVSDENNKNFEVIGVEKVVFNAKSDIMIQTNCPLPGISQADWFHYYEITILSNPNNDETIIAIGLAPKNFPTNRLPGCNTDSIGFHSDEGRIFRNEKYTGSTYAEKWGKVNDVIGCGYYPNNRQVFFTINGENLGIAYTGLLHNILYPTIGSNGHCILKVNFGPEFEYKEANIMSVASKKLLNASKKLLNENEIP